VVILPKTALPRRKSMIKIRRQYHLNNTHVHKNGMKSPNFNVIVIFYDLKRKNSSLFKRIYYVGGLLQSTCKWEKSNLHQI